MCKAPSSGGRPLLHLGDLVIAQLGGTFRGDEPCKLRNFGRLTAVALRQVAGKPRVRDRQLVPQLLEALEQPPYFQPRRRIAELGAAVAAGQRYGMQHGHPRRIG